MMDRKPYPMKSARAFYRPGELVIVAVCPYPLKPQLIGIARTLLTVEPPSFELFSWRFTPFGGGGGVQSLTVPPDWPLPKPPVNWPPGGTWPWPPPVWPPPTWPPHLGETVTVTEVFTMVRRPDVIKLYHADGSTEIPVQDIAEGEPAAATGGGIGVAKLMADAKGGAVIADSARERSKRSGAASVDATGYADTSMEDAFRDAVARAFDDLPPSDVMDGMTRVEIRSSGAIYGGIQGLVGRYYVDVRATRQ